MAETDYTAAETAAFDRLPQYNVRNGGEGTSNPFGFGNGGYKSNQMRQADDVGIVGRYVRRLALYVAGLVALADEDARNTALDRIATSQNVTTAAGSVTAARAEADRSRNEADRAASYGNPNALTTERLFQLYW